MLGYCLSFPVRSRDCSLSTSFMEFDFRSCDVARRRVLSVGVKGTGWLLERFFDRFGKFYR